MKQLSPLASLLILSACFGLFVAVALFVYRRERPKKPMLVRASPSDVLKNSEPPRTEQRPSSSSQMEKDSYVDQNIGTQNSVAQPLQNGQNAPAHVDLVG
ncbi:MAG: hypothetical protein ACK5T6_02305, partial [Pirellula sp.]